MQQPPRRAPSPFANLVLAIFLGIPGAINLVSGIGRGNAGSIICGIASLAYALLLLREALSLHKTGMPSMSQKHMVLIGFGFLGVYMVGAFLKYR